MKLTLALLSSTALALLPVPAMADSGPPRPITAPAPQTYINATLYGASPALADNSGALNSMISKFSTGCFYFPGGNGQYNFSVQPNALSSGQSLCGDGIGSTILNATYTPTDNTPFIQCSTATPTTVTATRCGISNLRLVRNSSAAAFGVGFLFNNVTFGWMDHAEASGFYRAVEIAGGDIINITNSHIGANSAYSTTTANSSYLYIHSISNGAGGILEPFQIYIVGTSMTGPAAGAVTDKGLWVTAVDGFSMTSSYVGEANDNGYFKLEDSNTSYFSDVSIVSNFFDGNVGESARSMAFVFNSLNASSIGDFTISGNIFGTNQTNGSGLSLGMGGTGSYTISGNTFQTASPILGGGGAARIAITGNRFSQIGGSNVISFGNGTTLGSLAVTGNTVVSTGTAGSKFLNLGALGNSLVPTIAVSGNSLNNILACATIDASLLAGGTLTGSDVEMDNNAWQRGACPVYAQGNAALTCAAGAPSASFATVLGKVTHC